MVFRVKRFVPALIWNTRGSKWSLRGADEVMLKLSAKVCPKKSVSDDRPPSQSMSNFIIITGSVLKNALGEWGLKRGLKGAPALESCQKIYYHYVLFFIKFFSVQNNLLEIESTTPHQWLQLHPT